MKRLTLILPSGRITTDMHKTVDLPFLQSLVGGFIELVPEFTTYEEAFCHAWMNEDGLKLELAVNETATRLWKAQLGGAAFWYEPIIYGPLLIEQVATSADREPLDFRKAIKAENRPRPRPAHRPRFR